MPRDDVGFTLVEALMAVGLLATAVVGVVQLFAVGTAAVGAAGDTTVETVLAAQKVQQLAALTWAFDRAGQRVSDTTGDTTVWPERAGGGTGLSPSLLDALDHDTPGYVDYVDRLGHTVAPADALYTRRWAIRPAAVEPLDTVVIDVIAARRDRLARLAAVPRNQRLSGIVRLVRLRSRRRP